MIESVLFLTAERQDLQPQILVLFHSTFATNAAHNLVP